MQELAGAYTPSLEAPYAAVAATAATGAAGYVTARGDTTAGSGASAATTATAAAAVSPPAPPAVSLQAPVVESQLQAISLEEPFALQATAGNLVEV